MRITETRVYFWAGILGNWTRVKGGIILPTENHIINLPTSEHVFMYLKAKYFEDTEIAEQITRVENPREAKRLGRLVKGFNEDRWISYREAAMWIALTKRYEYDLGFRNYLIKPEFKGKHFVEANPYDKVWSCGYLEDDPRIDLPENTWPGLNLLGKLLDRLRDEKS